MLLDKALDFIPVFIIIIIIITIVLLLWERAITQYIYLIL